MRYVDRPEICAQDIGKQRCSYYEQRQCLRSARVLTSFECIPEIAGNCCGAKQLQIRVVLCKIVANLCAEAKKSAGTKANLAETLSACSAYNAP